MVRRSGTDLRADRTVDSPYVRPDADPRYEANFGTDFAMPRAKQVTAWGGGSARDAGEVAAALGAKKVNIVAFMAPVIGGRGALRMIFDKPAMAKRIFAENGWETTEEDVLEVLLPDRPGSLGAIASKLGTAGVNIEYAYTGSARSAQRVNT